MKKRLWAMVMCLAMLITSVVANSMVVKAASQFTGDYFGLGFDYHESEKMEMADGWSNGGMFNCTWRSSNVNFADGILQLSINKASDGSYTGGEYRTTQAFGYGMYDVCMKPIKNDGVVTSFFTYTGPTDGTVWDEIDIEFLGKDTTKVQFNYFTNGVGNHEYVYDLGFDASLEYHQYGFYWAEDSITWYVDNVPVYTATDNIPSTPGKIMMNVWPGIGVDDWLNAYNGVAPLTGYYDWASYTSPNSSSGSTTEDSTTGSNVNFSATDLYMITAKHSGKALDVYWGNVDNGTNILQYPYCGYSNQQWYVQKLDNGYYIIKNLATGKVLDVADYSTENGGNVHQWEYVGGANQEWSIENVNGYYKLTNRLSGKVLDVSGISTEDNANVQQWEYCGQDNQLWAITKIN